MNLSRFLVCLSVLVAVLAVSAAPGADETTEARGRFFCASRSASRCH